MLKVNGARDMRAQRVRELATCDGSKELCLAAVRHRCKWPSRVDNGHERYGAERSFLKRPRIRPPELEEMNI